MLIIDISRDNEKVLNVLMESLKYLILNSYFSFVIEIVSNNLIRHGNNYYSETRFIDRFSISPSYT